MDSDTIENLKHNLRVAQRNWDAVKRRTNRTHKEQKAIAKACLDEAKINLDRALQDVHPPALVSAAPQSPSPNIASAVPSHNAVTPTSTRVPVSLTANASPMVATTEVDSAQAPKIHAPTVHTPISQALDVQTSAALPSLQQGAPPIPTFIQAPALQLVSPQGRIARVPSPTFLNPGPYSGLTHLGSTGDGSGVTTVQTFVSAMHPQQNSKSQRHASGSSDWNTHDMARGGDEDETTSGGSATAGLLSHMTDTQVFDVHGLSEDGIGKRHIPTSRLSIEHMDPAQGPRAKQQAYMQRLSTSPSIEEGARFDNNALHNHFHNSLYLDTNAQRECHSPAQPAGVDGNFNTEPCGSENQFSKPYQESCLNTLSPSLLTPSEHDIFGPPTSPVDASSYTKMRRADEDNTSGRETPCSRKEVAIPGRRAPLQDSVLNSCQYPTPNLSLSARDELSETSTQHDTLIPAVATPHSSSVYDSEAHREFFSSSSLREWNNFMLERMEEGTLPPAYMSEPQQYGIVGSAGPLKAINPETQIPQLQPSASASQTNFEGSCSPRNDAHTRRLPFGYSSEKSIKFQSNAEVSQAALGDSGPFRIEPHTDRPLLARPLLAACPALAGSTQSQPSVTSSQDAQVTLADAHSARNGTPTSFLPTPTSGRPEHQSPAERNGDPILRHTTHSQSDLESTANESTATVSMPDEREIESQCNSLRLNEAQDRVLQIKQIISDLKKSRLETATEINRYGVAFQDKSSDLDFTTLLQKTRPLQDSIDGFDRDIEKHSLSLRNAEVHLVELRRHECDLKMRQVLQETLFKIRSQLDQYKDLTWDIFTGLQSTGRRAEGRLKEVEERLRHSSVKFGELGEDSASMSHEAAAEEAGSDAEKYKQQSEHCQESRKRKSARQISSEDDSDDAGEGLEESQPRKKQKLVRKVPHTKKGLQRDEDDKGQSHDSVERLSASRIKALVGKVGPDKKKKAKKRNDSNNDVEMDDGDDDVPFGEHCPIPGLTADEYEELEREGRMQINDFLITGDREAITASIRLLALKYQGFLPHSSYQRRELALAMHYTSQHNYRCRYHVKYKDRSVYDGSPGHYNVEGIGIQPDMRTNTKDDAHMNCGCPVDDVLEEYFYWKTWTAHSTNPALSKYEEGMAGILTAPRFRSFVCQAFRKITRLTLDDIYSWSQTGTPFLTFTAMIQVYRLAKELCEAGKDIELWVDGQKIISSGVHKGGNDALGHST